MTTDTPLPGVAALEILGYAIDPATASSNQRMLYSNGRDWRLSAWESC